MNVDPFLNSSCRKQWQRLGVDRRAGVCVPLFSLYSEQSIGVGEIPDLKLLIEWCQKSGMSLIQLLPLNDVGFRFTPYDAESSFALDPLHLSLRELRGVPTADFKKELKVLATLFPVGQGPVNYEVKKAKLELLLKLFQSWDGRDQKDFELFQQMQRFWLEDYSLFRILKEKNEQASWSDWPEEEKNRDEDFLATLREESVEAIEFQKWLQWQLYLQFQSVRQVAEEAQVFLMGDLPFLVSRDSADVWANQDYFKLDRLAGAPPDLYFSKGQRWGMPPYDWPAIERAGYDYLIQKLKYAENFYDLFRVDHAVGVFRVWTIAESEPEEHGGMRGHFDPEDESVWEEHGKKILQVMIENTRMLPCAEDLGVIPNCCPPTLEALAIPGMNIQRWTRDWGNTYDFLPPEAYRRNSVVVVSTHDMSTLPGWWELEVGTVDAFLFEKSCADRGMDFEKVKPSLFDLEKSSSGRLRWKREIDSVEKMLFVLELAEGDAWDFVDMYRGSFYDRERFLDFLGTQDTENQKRLAQIVLEKAGGAESIFSIQIILDYFLLDEAYSLEVGEDRINYPGTCGPQNWTLTLPWSLEEMLKSSLPETIKVLHQKTNRI